MSAGAFVIESYGASYEAGAIHPITIQPETLTLNIGGPNVAVEGAPNNPISAVVSRGKRSAGLNARTVTFRFDEGEAPDDYQERAVITLPWLNPATFGPIIRGATGTYLGGAVTVVGKSQETAR